MSFISSIFLIILQLLIIKNSYIDASSNRSKHSSTSIESVVDLKTKINRLLINNYNNKVELFVTSKNHLYKLTDTTSYVFGNNNDVEIFKSNLKIDIDLVTGPKIQKQQCAFIVEPSQSSHSSRITQCIKYVCDDDVSNVNNKITLLKSSNGNQQNGNQRTQQQLVDYENRLLLIDNKNEHLIECGTSDYGGCRLRNLNDLSIIGCNYSAPVIPFNSASGVVVSGTKTNKNEESSLYLMVSNEYDPTERLDKSDFPVFSVRYLATSQTQSLFQSKYPIESMNYDQTIFNPEFHMKIIFSFKHEGFIYFLFTITNKMLSESCNRMDAAESNLNSNQTNNKIVTRMLRICDPKWSAGDSTNSDSGRFNRENQETIDQITNLYANGGNGGGSLGAGSATNLATLTETVIDCEDGQTGAKYHLLQSATFHQFSYNKSTYEDNSVLFMTFNSSSSSSVVCKIKIKEIDKHFVTMLHKCLDGDNSYAELVSPYSNKNTWKTPCRCSIINDSSRKSTQSDIYNERKLFCHNDLFNYMNSRQTLTLKSIDLDLKTNQLKPITSIATLNINENLDSKIVLILATLDAQIVLMNYDPLSEDNKAYKYDKISLIDSLEQQQSSKLLMESALGINLAVDDTSSKFDTNDKNNTLNNLKNIHRSLYVTYDRFLFKINLQNCEKFHTCETCLGGKSNNIFSSNTKSNPFCGWCVYEQKCMLKQVCIEQSILRKQTTDQNQNIRKMFTDPLASLWLTSKSNDSAPSMTCPKITHLKPSRFVNPIFYTNSESLGSLGKRIDPLKLFLNINLMPITQYYCDLNLNNFQYQTLSTNSMIQQSRLISYRPSLKLKETRSENLNRVKAESISSSGLQCDLMAIKNHFEQIIKSNPIRRKFLNVSLEIRASTSSLPSIENSLSENELRFNKASPLTTALVASTNLYAFNCTYFADCSQCLNKKLANSCTWCASNSKCIFSKKNNENGNDSECPNEVDFYQQKEKNNNVCLSYSLFSNLNENQNTKIQAAKKNKVEIAFSGDSNLSILINNPRLTYQKRFQCLFTTTRSLKEIKKLISLNKKLTTSVLIEEAKNLKNSNNILSNCKYSPYNDLHQLNPNQASQTIYMSVWWQTNTNDKNIEVNLLNGWNQVEFKQNENNEEDSLDDESLFANQDDDIINEKNFIELNVVNCKVKASSCGKCMEKQLIDLGCGWCRSTNKCSLKKDCPVFLAKSSKLNTNWINELNGYGLNSYCSDPKILEMQPKCGPNIGGGTQIVLNGENLGHTPFDVKVKLKPLNDMANENDIECSIITENYVKSSRIVCKTKSLMNSGIKTNSNIYSVYVQTNTNSQTSDSVLYSSFNLSNQFLFKYITPQISSIEPRRGIKSGGTILKITGNYLSCGSDLRFTIDNAECPIINITSSSSSSSFDLQSDVVYCKTPPFIQKNEFQLHQKSASYFKMKMDDYNDKTSSFKFEYIEDPKIIAIEPDRTIASGGLYLTIKGKDFDILQSANLVVSPTPILSSLVLSERNIIFSSSSEDSSSNDYNIVSSESDNGIAKSNNLFFKSTCNILNSTTIQCLMPQIKDKRLAASLFSVSPLSSLEYFSYIQFNDIQTKFAYQHQMNVFSDPTFEDAQVFSDKTPIILIKGDNLLRGVRETDYRVLIGPNNIECNITSITMNLIACILPDQTSIRSETNQNEQMFATRKKRKTDSKDVILTKSKTYEVKIQIGQKFVQTIGFLKYEKDAMSKYDVIEIKYIIVAACLTSLILFSVMISCFIILKRRQNKQIRQLKRMQTEFENLEMRVARECKEAFTELQMDIGELANTLNQTGAPFNEFQNYCIKILFPNANESVRLFLTTPIDLRLSSGNRDNVKNGVLMFSQLILNKKFLLTFIHTLEADTHTFLLQDRVNLASYLSICLHDRMDYFTDILMTLLAELIEKLIDSKNNPKIFLRRNESVAEKMLTNWFTFLLYDFIKDCAGTPLYILFLSLKQQIYKGPVDSVTCEARYSLSEDKLIRQSIDYDPIIIRAQFQDINDNSNKLQEPVHVKVLNCDTITQVKEKILDAFFKGYPFSKRPCANDLDLVYVSDEYNFKSNNNRLILYDEDKTSKVDCDDYKRLNTLSHYKILNGSLLLLVSRSNYQVIQSSNQNTNLNDGSSSYRLLDAAVNSRNAENMTLLSTSSSKGSSSPPTYSKLSANGFSDINSTGNGVYSAMNGSSVGLTEYILNSNQNNNSNRFNTTSSTNKKSLLLLNSNNNNISHSKSKRYHLIKPNDLLNSTTPNLKEDKSNKQQIAAKLVSEVYLTRLLATKGGMQSYVDDFFESVFSTAHGSNVLPFAIKYLFDFLDEQANIHGITDPEVVYTWKSNSLPLRFWVNIIKNPDFVFDIYKSNIVDASLSVIASTFMDSCCQSRLDLNKESPSGKLLFYKEVHKYRKWVESYYSEIKQMPKIDNQELNEILCEESKKRHNSFNKNNALYRLYNDYVKKYRTKIEKSLNDEYQEPSIISINKHLNYRLQQVIYLMDAIEV